LILKSLAISHDKNMLILFLEKERKQKENEGEIFKSHCRIQIVILKSLPTVPFIHLIHS